MPSIRLKPVEIPRPRTAHIPFNRALYWQSPFESNSSEPAVSVFVAPRAFVRVSAHAGSDLDNEVGGWLIGKWRLDKNLNQQFIVVENSLPAPFTRQGQAFLTFTQDSQVALQNLLEERFPGKDLVGWYHTHPRMGVFFHPMTPGYTPISFPGCTRLPWSLNHTHQQVVSSFGEKMAAWTQGDTMVFMS